MVVCVERSVEVKDDVPVVLPVVESEDVAVLVAVVVAVEEAVADAVDESVEVGVDVCELASQPAKPPPLCSLTSSVSTAAALLHPGPVDMINPPRLHRKSPRAPEGVVLCSIAAFNPATSTPQPAGLERIAPLLASSSGNIVEQVSGLDPAANVLPHSSASAFSSGRCRLHPTGTVRYATPPLAEHVSCTPAGVVVAVVVAVLTLQPAAPSPYFSIAASNPAIVAEQVETSRIQPSGSHPIPSSFESTPIVDSSTMRARTFAALVH